MRMQRRRKKGQGEAASAPPLQAQFQSRPFQDANTLTNKQAAPPEMQLQPEPQGFDFASIPLFANSATSSQPIQRQEEDNDLQMKPEPDAIQRMGEDDEMQMKPEPDAIQRMGKDDDEMQMKPEPDAIQRMGKDDDEMQMKPEPDAIQRMGKDDDEMQMKPESNGSINPLLKNLVQRDHLETPVPRIPIQAQLTIGAPGDKYEQEADQVAHNVVEQINAPAPNTTQSDTSVQREMVEEDDQMQMKPIVQRQELDGGVEAPTEVESSINQAKGGGQSLDTGLQRSMGQAMGADFSGVKVHTDSQADTLNQSLQAKAFTTGQHVFFKKGEYQPSNKGGQELIAHELTHVVQQGSAGTNSPKAQPKRLENSEYVYQPIAPVRQSTSPTIQRYIDLFKYTQKARETDTKLVPLSGLFSEGGNILHRGKQNVYATQSKINESNQALEASGSFVRLVKGGKTFWNQRKRREIGRDHPDLPTPKKLYSVTPEWSAKDDPGIHGSVQEKNQETKENGMKKYDKLQLWQDCRKSSAAVMGSSDVTREIQYEVNNEIQKIQNAEPGYLLNAIYTAMLPVFLVENPGYVQDVHRQDNASDGDLRTIVSNKDKVSGNLNQRTKMYCRDAYAALPASAQNEFDAQYGLGKYVLPDVGQGYSMVTKWDVEGFKTKSDSTFAYHWAGVVMQDGNNRLTLEQASRGEENEITDNWELNLYGTEEGQSFQEKQHKTVQFGNKNTVIRVQNPTPEQGADD